MSFEALVDILVLDWLVDMVEFVDTAVVDMVEFAALVETAIYLMGFAALAWVMS